MWIRKLVKIPPGSYLLLKWEKRKKRGLFWRVGTRKNVRVEGDFPDLLGKGGTLRVNSMKVRGERHYSVTSPRT